MREHLVAHRRRSDPAIEGGDFRWNSRDFYMAIDTGGIGTLVAQFPALPGTDACEAVCGVRRHLNSGPGGRSLSTWQGDRWRDRRK